MIQTHGNSFIQSPILIGNIKSPILIGNIKAQFLLAIPKPNSCWQHQNPIFISITLSKRKRAQDNQCLAKKKYHGKMLSWQKRTMAIILWKNSLRAILRIMFSYYKPMKYMDIITTSIIYTFNTYGKTFKLTSSSFKLLETMNIAIWNSS